MPRGIYVRTPEYREKQKKAQLGKKHTEESKRKISLARKGIIFSTEHKKNLSEAKNSGKFPIGSSHPRWKGGRFKVKSGYVYVKDPAHPFPNKPYGYVLEHRLVMEKHIGRYLNPEEVVHHINGIKDDNRIENLMLFPNKAAHNSFHKFLREKEE